MNVYLIRHGETKGNKEHRYIGSTDEGLLPEAKEELHKKTEYVKELVAKEKQTALYVSPLLRCRETAQLLFPKQAYQLVEDFRECNFGIFEYKNFEELNGNAEYQEFIDSNGECGFPGGETKQEFTKRCVRAFMSLPEVKIIRQKEIADGTERKLILVVHGGTIMALLDQLSFPHRDYYDWQLKPGEGYVAEIACGKDNRICLTQIKKVLKTEKT